MYRRRALLILLIVLACAVTPSRAEAHPADMYAQEQFIVLGGSRLQIDWRILPGPFLADAVWAAADSNHDGAISDEEARAWVAPFLSGLSIELDSQPATADVNSIHWPATVDLLRTGEDAVKVMLAADWSSGLAGRHALEIHNSYLEPNSLNWFSLSASGGLSFGRPAQDNGRLTLDLIFPAGGTSRSPASGAMASWTSGTPNLPDFTASLSKVAAKLAGANAASMGSQVAQSGTTAMTSALTGLVRNVQLSPYFLLSAFLLSLALGSLHALTPGHGKTLVGAYLVGSQGRTRDAVVLGGIVTLTHTGSVLVLGLVTLVASHYILPSLILPWLELLSGLLVILFGLNLLVQRARQRGHGQGHAHGHEQFVVIRNAGAKTSPVGAPDRITEMQVLSSHAKSHLLAPWRPGKKEEPVLPHRPSSIKDSSSEISVRSLLALGVSGGLVPCPDAIAILLVAVALNRVPFGMLLIVAFSIGLAAVLIAIGITMVRGVSAIQRSALVARNDWLTRFGAYTPVISAIVVTGLGAGLTINAWRSFEFSRTPSLAGGLPGRTQPVASVNARLGAGSSSQFPLLYIAADSSGHDQLFLLSQPGAAPTQYTQESNGITGYSLSPDARIVLYSVFTLDGGSSIWSLPLDTSGGSVSAHRVLDCPQAECNTPVFYPDGSKVAYERLENTTDATTIPRFSIWWLDLHSGKTQPVFQDAAFPSTAPQFSPDGRWLSYISAASNTLLAFDLQNGRTVSVPLGSQAAIPETWSPDGRALLFGNTVKVSSAAPVALSQAAAGPVHVKIYLLASSKVTDLSAGPNVTDYSAAWSPDGGWIAIDRSVPGADPSSGGNQVWLVRPDGTQAHVLLSEAGASYSSLSWSPDGRTLLYSRYTLDLSTGGTGRFDVCSIEISTGHVAVLVPGGDIAQFVP